MRITEQEVTPPPAYVQVVLQGLWCGSVAGREAQVVFEGVFVGQELVGFPARVGQLTPDGTELLQWNSAGRESG